MSDKYQFDTDRSQDCNTRQDLYGLKDWIRGVPNTDSEDAHGVNSAFVVSFRFQRADLFLFHQLDKNGLSVYSASNPNTNSVQ